MALRLLDTPHLEHEGNRLEVLPTKPAALLLYLAVQGDWVNRDLLASVFAPEVEESSARHHLRVLLNRARQFPWSAQLEIETSRLRFSIPNDVQAFRQAIGKGDWAEAVELHRKPLLEGFHVGAPAFEAWCEAEREAFARAWREAACRRARELSRDEPATAARLLRGVLEHDDLSEDVVQVYLECAYLTGRREEALREYERFRDRLHEELDLEPLEATVRLAEMIRRAEAIQATPQPMRPKPGVPIRVLRPPRMMGRARELEAILASKAAVTLLAAEPGSGKTRLLEEAVSDARWLRCREGLEGVPYQPVIETLRAGGMKLPDLGPYAEDLARLIPELVPDARPGPAEPVSAKARLLEALARALEADPSPLVVDDLQWADAATLELIVFLAARGKSRIFGAYRSDEVGASLENALASLRSGQGLETIRLEAISPEAMRALLAELIGTNEGPERFSGWLTERSGGNPFFALETLKALFESGALEERDGVWHTALDEITTDYRELEVPGRVAQLVERRVLRLSEPARRVVQAASVVREGFTVKLLSGVVGLSEFAVLDALEEVEKAGLVVNARFHHDITRQSVYGGLADARRRALHLRVAEGLEGAAEPLVIAQHWLEGGEEAKAFPRLLEAAGDYRDRGLLEAHRRVLEQALAHAPGAAQKLEVQHDLAWVQFYLANSLEAERLIEPVLAQVHDPRIRAFALNLRSELLLYRGHVAQAAQANTQALEIGEQAGLDCSSLRTTGAHIAQTEGRFEDAIALLEPVIAHGRGQAPTERLGSALISLGSAYNELGDYEAGERLNKEGWEMAREIGARHRQVNAAVNLAYALARQNRLEESVEVQEAALKLGEFTNTATLRNNLAADYLKLGRLNEARAVCEALVVSCDDPTLCCVSWARLAKIYAQLGLGAEKTQALERGIALLAQTEYEVAQVGVVIAVLDIGSDAQLERLTPSFVGKRFSNPYAQEKYEQAISRRLGRTFLA